ncbi:flagellar basal body rod C-terminal domain-containing protein [Clostridioides difficile]|uniref:flagellar basal body rod C-terminal domain-containing protein n=1 Tax=Clostridioides difficile TaxID=1496 RepID=UPI0028A4A3EB|nr:flagellar basal body rod C-terminal domain-containing protein [Clostridioides difficile]KAK2342589.1 hypothetical protein XC56_07910 [Clostridioides difficile]
MYTMFYASKTALSANQSKLDIISNNIANSDSTGYKKINMEYSDLVDEVLNRPSYPTNGKDISTGTGAKATAPMRNYEQPIGTQNFISEGDSLFVATDAAQIKQVEKVDIVQGYRERSNVSLQEEFVDLIATQRAFQMNSKGIKTADEMWQIANNLRAK